MEWRRVPLAAAGVAIAGSLAALPAQAQCNAYELTPAFHATGSSPTAVAAGDLNGDGRIDLVLSDPTDATVAILVGHARQGFAPPLVLAAGHLPRAVELGDLDGDLDLDIAVCDGGYLDPLLQAWTGFGVRILWNGGGGAFGSSSFVPLPAGQIQPTDVGLGDLDKDGDLDLVLAVHGSGGTLNSRVASFLNDGTGQFGPALLASTGYDPVGLALGDLDGDTVLDVVTVNYFSGTLTILRGNGDGTFSTVFGHATGSYPRDVALADLDGDGDLDASIPYHNGVHVLRNDGGILNWLATLYEGVHPVGVAFADLDGDLDLDLIAADDFGDAVLVWHGGPGSAFAFAQSHPVGDGPVAAIAADFDGDGAPDLALALANAGGVATMRNECPLSSYCTAKPNSQGCTPAIGWTGTPSLGGADDFHVVALNVINQKAGVVFFGLASAAMPFGGGLLCVQPPLVRTPVQSSGGNPLPDDCSGAYDFHASHAWLATQGWSAGLDVFAQWWSRDPSHPDGTGIGLSDALRFNLQP